MDNAIRQQLFAAADASYQTFSASLLPGTDHILGVRLPLLRKMAQQIYRKGDWAAFLAEQPLYFEETMLQGMVIGHAVKTFVDFRQYVPPFVPKIDNWSVCDSFCNSLHAAQDFREPLLADLRGYTQSAKEFEVRFGAVMLMDYYVDETYLPQVLSLLEAIRHEGYYAKMAVAWALSVCFAKFPAQTLSFLRSCQLDRDTYQKTLQKILESRRVSAADKDIIRAMKKKGVPEQD